MRRIATGAALLALVASAFEGTVVTSAMPTIARTLDGLHAYGWVFTAYLVSSMFAILVAGRLADAYGRKPLFAFGMGLFVIGSVLCGTASSIEALIAFRVIQGLGAGALQPLTMTIIGDLYEIEERARVQALFTSSWGLANLLGPPLGGALVTHLGWRAVFFVNVPIGLIAVLLLSISFRDRPRASGRPALHGAIGFGFAAAAATIALGPIAAAPARVALGLLAVALGIFFVVDQRRTASPIVSARALANPEVRAGLAAGVAVGALLHATAAYVPLFATVARGASPLGAGLAIVPLLIGWAIGSGFGVRILIRRGLRATIALGSALGAFGAIVFASTTALGGPWSLATTGLFVFGLGLGPIGSTTIVATQRAVARQERASVTSAVYAARALGGSLAMALLGVVPRGLVFPSIALAAALAAVALHALGREKSSSLDAQIAELRRSDVRPREPLRPTRDAGRRGSARARRHRSATRGGSTGRGPRRGSGRPGRSSRETDRLRRGRAACARRRVCARRAPRPPRSRTVGTGA
jgi:MFS family permease